MIRQKLRFRIDEKLIEELIGDFESWNHMMKFAEQHCDSLMELYDLEYIYWTNEGVEEND